MPTFEEYRDGYRSQWDAMQVRPEWAERARGQAQSIMDARRHYEPVSGATGVPWHIIGIIHRMECGGSFRGHLHNGDPLTARTRQVPRGRPVVGSPPFTWEDSAIDALRYDGLDKVDEWSPERIAWCLEKFNGFGNRRHNVPSPYLWAGSNQYIRGKYISDGVWSSSAVSQQIGGMILLKTMQELDPSLVAGDTLKEAADAFPKAEKEPVSSSADEAATQHAEAHESLMDSSWTYYLNRINIKTVTGGAGAAMIYLQDHMLEIGAGAVVAVIIFEAIQYAQRTRSIAQ
jgi:lysozyme family protein